MRKPIINASATRYIFLMSIAFATSVVVTRWYLELANYPQLGNATFHFAHALWGGLLQVIATLLMFIYVNRWMRDVSAVLAGVGAGLFIDEVGKFITQTNDYFFPLAAPIIYVAFLLIILVYLVLKRRRSALDLRAETYQVLSELEEVLESDLSVSERGLMVSRLERITQQTTRPDLAALAQHMLTFLQSDAVTVVPDKPSALQGWLTRWKSFEERFLTQTTFRRLLIAVCFINGIGTLLILFTLIAIIVGSETTIPDILEALVLDTSRTGTAAGLTWYVIMTVLHMLTGLFLFASAVSFLIKRDRLAVALGVLAMIITLTFINTLSFYYNQFSIVVSSIESFAILMALQRYRDRFLPARLQPLDG